jgi:hypothetical protein
VSVLRVKPRNLALNTAELRFKHPNPQLEIFDVVPGTVDRSPYVPQVLQDEVVVWVAHNAIIAYKQIENK